ncbi:hypothetical protein [Bacillus fonticola]|uniref:hypothetical protein n=1 Tax=Bacillus fonticola TaxID=2728853 RepID=UPI001473A8DE|nr:hypothetical protein [Bacillus fonticola]
MQTPTLVNKEECLQQLSKLAASIDAVEELMTSRLQEEEQGLQEVRATIRGLQLELTQIERHTSEESPTGTMITGREPLLLEFS